MTIENYKKASVRIVGEADDESINRYELSSALRALRLIKSSLGQERLYDLVKPQIAEGNALFREHVKNSAGKQATGTVKIEAIGLKAADFAAWMLRAFSRAEVLIAAHPEHYAMDISIPGRPLIVETLGDHVIAFKMAGWEKASDGSTESTDKRQSLMVLADDETVFGSVATLFTDTTDGMIAELSVTLPATSAPYAINQHLEHFSVEFRNWMLMAAEDIRVGA
jgi:hypothetical protein